MGSKTRSTTTSMAERAAPMTERQLLKEVRPREAAQKFKGEFARRLRFEPSTRILLAVTFIPGAVNYWTTVFFGWNWLLPTNPLPSPLPPMYHLLIALDQTQTMLLIKLVTTSSALLLLFNRAVPLAIALLTPVTAGMILVHCILAPLTVGVGPLVIVEIVWVAIVVVCEVILARMHAANFATLFSSLRSSKQAV